MRFGLRQIWLAVLLAGTTLGSGTAFAGQKLKGFYAGSGGISPEVHHLVFVEFATDGTAIVQQHWDAKKDPEVWHTHWTQNGKQVKIVFDPVKNGDTPKPLLMDFKNGALTATDWDATALGIGGPPKLTPFGGYNTQPGTATPCVALNSRDPTTQNCTTWDSRR